MSVNSNADAISNPRLRGAVERLERGADPEPMVARRELAQALRDGTVLLPRRRTATGDAELVVGAAPSGRPVLLFFSGPERLRAWAGKGAVLFRSSSGIDALRLARQHEAETVVIDPGSDARPVALSRQEIDAILDGFGLVTPATPDPGTPARLEALEGADQRLTRRAQAVPPGLRALLDAEVVAGTLRAAFVVEEGSASSTWRLMVALYPGAPEGEAADRQVADLGGRIAEVLVPGTSIDIRQIDGRTVDFYAALDPEGSRVER